MWYSFVAGRDVGVAGESNSPNANQAARSGDQSASVVAGSRSGWVAWNPLGSQPAWARIRRRRVRGQRAVPPVARHYRPLRALGAHYQRLQESVRQDRLAQFAVRVGPIADMVRRSSPPRR